MLSDDPEIQTIKDRIPKQWGKWVSVDDGWLPLVAKLNRDIEALYPDYEIYQVKEKFGLLRYYCSVESEPKVAALIQQAEDISGRTCEACGEPGETTGTHWLRTECQSHREERLAKRSAT